MESRARRHAARFGVTDSDASSDDDDSDGSGSESGRLPRGLPRGLPASIAARLPPAVAHDDSSSEDDTERPTRQPTPPPSTQTGTGIVAERRRGAKRGGSGGMMGAGDPAVATAATPPDRQMPVATPVQGHSRGSTGGNSRDRAIPGSHKTHSSVMGGKGAGKASGARRQGKSVASVSSESASREQVQRTNLKAAAVAPSSGGGDGSTKISTSESVGAGGFRGGSRGVSGDEAAGAKTPGTHPVGSATARQADQGRPGGAGQHSAAAPSSGSKAVPWPKSAGGGRRYPGVSVSSGPAARKVPPKEHKTRGGKALPLHQAIEDNSESERIEMMLEMHRADLKKPSKGGDLPLHVALKCGCSPAVVKAIAQAAPSAALEPLTESSAPLQFAIEHEVDPEVVRSLLNACPDAARSVAEDGRSMLALAIDMEVEGDVVSAILDAYPAALTGMGRDALLLLRDLLHVAPEAVFRAVQHLPPLLALHDDNGRTLLHLAAFAGAEELVLHILDSNPSAANAEANDGEFPLHSACMGTGNPTCVTALVNCYEGAASRTLHGALPLHLLLQSSADLEAVTNLLLTHPDAARQVDRDGKFPIHYAAIAPTCRVLMSQIGFMIKRCPEALQRKTAEGEYMLNTVVRGSVPDDLVQHVVRAFPQAAAHAPYGQPLPLYVAIDKKRSRSTLEALVKANPKALESHVYLSAFPLPVHLAIANGSPEDCILFLLDSAPQTAKAPVAGGSAIHLAIMKRSSPRVVERIVKHYPDAAKQQHGGTKRRALDLALEHRVSEATFVAVLDAYPTAVEWTLARAENPLVAALHCGVRPRAVAKLIDACPSTAKQTDDTGRLPLHVAIELRVDGIVCDAICRAFPDGAAVEDPTTKRLPKDIVLDSGVPRGISDAVFTALQSL